MESLCGANNISIVILGDNSSSQNEDSNLYPGGFFDDNIKKLDFTAGDDEQLELKIFNASNLVGRELKSYVDDSRRLNYMRPPLNDFATVHAVIIVVDMSGESKDIIASVDEQVWIISGPDFQKRIVREYGFQLQLMIVGKNIEMRLAQGESELAIHANLEECVHKAFKERAGESYALEQLTAESLPSACYAVARSKDVVKLFFKAADMVINRCVRDSNCGEVNRSSILRRLQAEVGKLENATVKVVDSLRLEILNCLQVEVVKLSVRISVSSMARKINSLNGLNQHEYERQRGALNSVIEIIESRKTLAQLRHILTSAINCDDNRKLPSAVKLFTSLTATLEQKISLDRRLQALIALYSVIDKTMSPKTATELVGILTDAANCPKIRKFPDVVTLLATLILEYQEVQSAEVSPRSAFDFFDSDRESAMLREAAERRFSPAAASGLSAPVPIVGEPISEVLQLLPEGSSSAIRDGAVADPVSDVLETDAHQPTAPPMLASPGAVGETNYSLPIPEAKESAPPYSGGAAAVNDPDAGPDGPGDSLENLKKTLSCSVAIGELLENPVRPCFRDALGGLELGPPLNKAVADQLPVDAEGNRRCPVTRRKFKNYAADGTLASAVGLFRECGLNRESELPTAQSADPAVIARKNI